MTNNPFKYGNVPIKGEGEQIMAEREMTIEEELKDLRAEVRKLYRYRAIYRRLATVARDGNLMFNTPHHGFVLVEDLEQYMGEKL